MSTTVPVKSPRSQHQFAIADFACPICMELLCSPRTPTCGHTFCEHCLQAWFDNTPAPDSSHATCPVDRATLSSTVPDVNILLQELIRQAFPTEYTKREAAVRELRQVKLLRDLQFIFCRSAHNATMVSRLGSEEHGYLHNEAIVHAMLQLPRGEFMPPSLRSEAYEFRPSRIEALAFNVSAPNMYSFCMEQLELAPGHAFLDIGSGCGLFTALAAQLVGRTGIVHGIDIRPEIIAFAHRNITIQKRRLMTARKQREEYQSCPKTGAFVPGSVFVGTCSEQAGRTKYPAKLIIDNRKGNEIEARFYWQTFGKTVTRLEGTLDLGSDDSPVKVELQEVQVMSTQLDRIVWLPCWYRFTFDAKNGKMVGSFGTCKLHSGGATSLTMTHLPMPDDDVNLDTLEFHQVNCFHLRPPLNTVVKQRKGYDRIHCGATCPMSLLPRLTRLLAPGGIMMVPVDSAMMKVVKDATTEAITSSPVLAVRYGELEVPPDVDSSDEEVAPNPEPVEEQHAPAEAPVEHTVKTQSEAAETPQVEEMLVDKASDEVEDEGRPKKRKYEGDGRGSPEQDTEDKADNVPVNDVKMEESDLLSCPEAESTEIPDPTITDVDNTIPLEAPMFAYYTKCCGREIIEAKHIVPEDVLKQRIGGSLELPDGESVMCHQASNVEVEDFQYVSDILQGRVSHVCCAQCKIHLGIKFIGEPPERGDEESYDGTLLITKAYLLDSKDKVTEGTEEGDHDAFVTCQKCSARICAGHQLLSTDHQWTLAGAPASSNPEKAAYLNSVLPEAINVGEVKQARMSQGTAKYATIFCKNCDEEIGWKFLQHVHPHERIRLSWYFGRFGLVLSRVKGIRAEHPLTLTLSQLMQHLQLVGLFRHSTFDDNDDEGGPGALRHQTFTITGIARSDLTADDDDEEEEAEDHPTDDH